MVFGGGGGVVQFVVSSQFSFTQEETGGAKNARPTAPPLSNLSFACSRRPLQQVLVIFL